MLAHFDAAMDRASIDGHLTVSGAADSERLRARMDGILVDEMYACPTVPCRQSVFPMCHHEASFQRYNVEWSLVTRLSSRALIHHMRDTLHMPAPYQYLKEMEHASYDPVLERSAVAPHGHAEDESHFETRVRRFVAHLFEKHRHLARFDFTNVVQKAAGSSSGPGTGSSSGSASSDTMATAPSADIPLYSKNVFVCAPADTVDELRFVLNGKKARYDGDDKARAGRIYYFGGDF